MPRSLRYAGPHESLLRWGFIRYSRLLIEFRALVARSRSFDLREPEFSKDMSAELAKNRLVYDPEEER